MSTVHVSLTPRRLLNRSGSLAALPLRVRQMIDILVANSDEICNANCGHVTFDYHADEVRAKHEHFLTAE